MVRMKREGDWLCDASVGPSGLPQAQSGGGGLSPGFGKCSSGVLPGSGLALTCCRPSHPGSSAGLLGMVVVMDGWGSTRAWRWCAGCAGRDTQRPPVPRPCAPSEPYLRPHVAVCCAGHLWGGGTGWAACAAREEGLGQMRAQQSR